MRGSGSPNLLYKKSKLRLSAEKTWKRDLALFSFVYKQRDINERDNLLQKANAYIDLLEKAKDYIDFDEDVWEESLKKNLLEVLEFAYDNLGDYESDALFLRALNLVRDMEITEDNFIERNYYEDTYSETNHLQDYVDDFASRKFSKKGLEKVDKILKQINFDSGYHFYMQRGAVNHILKNGRLLCSGIGAGDPELVPSRFLDCPQCKDKWNNLSLADKEKVDKERSETDPNYSITEKEDLGENLWKEIQSGNIKNPEDLEKEELKLIENFICKEVYLRIYNPIRREPLRSYYTDTNKDEFQELIKEYIRTPSKETKQNINKKLKVNYEWR